MNNKSSKKREKVRESLNETGTYLEENKGFLVGAGLVVGNEVLKTTEKSLETKGGQTGAVVGTAGGVICGVSTGTILILFLVWIGVGWIPFFGWVIGAVIGIVLFIICFIGICAFIGSKINPRPAGANLENISVNDDDDAVVDVDVGVDVDVDAGVNKDGYIKL